MTPLVKPRHAVEKASIIIALSAWLILLSQAHAGAQSVENSRPQEGGVSATANRKKLILAFGGGGTRGTAHIGVLRELEKNHIKIDGIVGTSIGAIVGGLYCAGLTPDQIEKAMTNKAFMKSYLTVPVVFRLVIAPILYVPHIFGYHPYDGLYYGNKFAKHVDSVAETIPKNDNNPDLKIEKFPIAFNAVGVDLLTATPVAIEKGNLGRALQASSAIPFLRRPVLMAKDTFEYLPGEKRNDNKDCYLFVDGGPQANLPVQQAKALAEKLGGGVVVAVDTYGSFDTLTPADFRKIGATAQRSLAIMLSSVEKNDIARADLTIAPALSDINILSNNVPEAKKAMAEGDKACAASIDKIRDLLNK